MIGFVKASVLVTAGALLIISIIELSARAMISSVILLAATFAIHRRLPAFWWIALAALALAVASSLREFFRGQQTPLAFMCSMLGVLITALIGSWWWRQKGHFTRRS